MPGLLIVDDTQLIRKAITNIILKDLPGISPIFEAENGEQAVALAQKHQPDIVFMDIKMPVMNGLQATALIRKNVPHAKIIVLSAYDEFSFVQEALKLGAIDYLLKPLRPQKLIEVIHATQTMLKEDAKQQQALIEAHQRISEALIIIEANLVDDLIYNQSLSEALVKQNLKQLNKDLAMPTVMIVNIDNSSKVVKQLRPQKLLEKYNSLLAAIESVIDYPQKVLFGSWQLGQLVMILSTDFQWETIDDQKKLAQKIVSRISTHLNVPVTVGIGQRYTTFSDITISFVEARTARQYNKIERSVTHIKDVDNITPTHGYAYPLALEKELLENIRLKQKDISLELMNTIIDTLLSGNKDTPGMLYSYFSELLTLVSRTIIDNGAPAPFILDLSHRQMITLFSSPSPAHLRAWALNSVNELMSVTYDNEAEKPDQDPVRQAIEYIHKNYNNSDLTLGKVAETVGLSQSHLAYLLKERLGVNYTKYLAGLRIRHAKKLLRTTSMTVSAIAKLVGYPNPTSFYRIFQRQTTMTPNTYRETQTT